MPGVWEQDITGSLNQMSRNGLRRIRTALGHGKGYSWVGGRTVWVKVGR